MNSTTTQFCCASRTCPVERSFCEMEDRLLCLTSKVDCLLMLTQERYRTGGGPAIVRPPPPSAQSSVITTASFSADTTQPLDLSKPTKQRVGEY